MNPTHCCPPSQDGQTTLPSPAAAHHRCHSKTISPPCLPPDHSTERGQTLTGSEK